MKKAVFRVMMALFRGQRRKAASGGAYTPCPKVKVTVWLKKPEPEDRKHYKNREQKEKKL